MSKEGRLNKKLDGNKWLVPAATNVCDLVAPLPLVTKICAGPITGRQNCEQRVRLTKNDHCITLAIRDRTSAQEMRVYAKDLRAVMLSIARALRTAGIKIKFKKE